MSTKNLNLKEILAIAATVVLSSNAMACQAGNPKQNHKSHVKSAQMKEHACAKNMSGEHSCAKNISNNSNVKK
jgi:hypothetical protein